MQHIHQYVRRGSRHSKTRSGDVLYQCITPNCYHILGKSRLLNKESICNGCGAVFTLTASDLQRSKPRCINCRSDKEAKAFQTIQDVAARVLKPLEEKDEQRTDASREEDNETDDSPFQSPN